MTSTSPPRAAPGRAPAVLGVVVLLLAVLLHVATPAGAVEESASPTPDDGQSAVLIARGATVVATGRDGSPIAFGSGRRVVGQVEVRAAGAEGPGLEVVNDLPLEDYVRGVAEMPGTWPAAALEAQAIAARTYAWYQARSGVFAPRGYDICATVACQVYDGVRQVEGVLNAGWDAAVAATAGQVLLDAEGAPILARYFSTSGGRTRANAVVFPSTGDLPYLQAVDDPDDAIAPLHTWQVRFTREEFDAIMARGQRLRAASPAAGAVAVAGTDGRPRAVQVTGVDGTVVEIGAASFRTFVSAVAPDLFPSRFPGARADGRPMPATLPSSQVTFTVTPSEVVVDGRGWGHAVGLGQWGAKGKAERGLAADEILAAYYGGLVPTTSPLLPERIRVSLGTPDGPLTLRADDAIRIEVDGVAVVQRGHGTFRVGRTADGVELHAPPGWGRPLTLGVEDPEEGLRGGSDVRVALEISKASGIEVQVRDGGRVVGAGNFVAERPGRMVAVVPAPVDGGWPEGRLDVVVAAVDETGATVEQTAQVDVRTPQEAPPGTGADVEDEGTSALTGLALLLLILTGMAIGLLLLVMGAERRRETVDAS